MTRTVATLVKTLWSVRRTSSSARGAFGCAWLAVLIGPTKAFTAGVAPFVPAPFIETLLAASRISVSWTVVAKRRGALSGHYGHRA